ncbi:MAG: hypothetical protein ACYC1I_11975 [Acidimicrobiales bacterium]
MRTGLTKLTGAMSGVLVLASVLLPATISGAAPTAPISHKVAETGCGTNGAIPGTVTTSTDRGVTTTSTTYDGEITTTRIVPVGKSPSSARFMTSDEAGNEYFATTRARAVAAATAFNRANPGRVIDGGAVYYGRTKFQAMLTATKNGAGNGPGYVNGVPVTATPQFLATSNNGTAFWSNCSQARADALAHLDTNPAPKRVWHATNTFTGQVVISAVSAKAAAALAAYHYVTYTPGEVAIYGLDCQVLVANSATGLVTALRAQLAAQPYVAYGGNFVGYDTTGTNPADMVMFIGATQAKADALATAFSKRIVLGGVFVVDEGLCATVGPNINQVMAIQNIEGAPTWPPGPSAPVVNGFQFILGGSIDVGGLMMGLSSFVQATTPSSTTAWDGNSQQANDANDVGRFNAAYNMAYYDQGPYTGPPLTTTVGWTPPLLTTPYEPTHATLPTKAITCASIYSPEVGYTLPPTLTLLSYDCPPAYKEVTP